MMSRFKRRSAVAPKCNSAGVEVMLQSGWPRELAMPGHGRRRDALADPGAERADQFRPAGLPLSPNRKLEEAMSNFRSSAEN